MSDVAAVVVAVAVWLGALAAVPVPRAAGAALILAALAVRRPAVLAVGGFLLASALAAAAWAGLTPPAPATVRGEAVLVGDPVEVGQSLRVDLRLGDRRVEAWARGEPAGALRDRLAGEVVVVEGRLRPAPDDARDRLAVRHVAARLDVHAVGGWRSGGPAARTANELRRVLERGTASLAADRRALVHGFLLGDDRAVPPAVEADFRGAGLSHLLAVSGSNVAFTMAVVGPLLRRLGLRGRLLASFAVIGLFAVMTRAEPSVLRASAMAALACWTAFAGRPTSRLRILALAVAALLLVDPLLARSVGFQLSVGAAAGLVLLARPLADRLPGPRWLAEALGVTLAAQAGVAPFLLLAFGDMPVVTVVANLLAVPVAAPLTAWGFTAGFVAGVLGGDVAALLHVPTDLMVRWVAGVARVCASMPLGAADGRALVVTAGVVFALHRWRRLAAAVGVAALLVASRPAAVAADVELARGARLWRAGASVLVLDGDTDAGRVLDGLRRAGVGAIDLVVARRGGRSVGGVLVELRSRVPVRAVVAPAGHRIRDATAVGVATDLRLGALVVRLVPVGSGLDVDIGETASGGGAARGPPVRHHHARPRDGHPQPDARLVLRPRRPLGPRSVLPAGRGARHGRGRPARRGWGQGRTRA
jgi:competence protein ComEC